MKGNILIGIIIFGIIIAIGLMFYFEIQPGEKMYESQAYGFKLDYPGMWQEKGAIPEKIIINEAEGTKVATFINEIGSGFRSNTDVSVFSAGTCETLLEDMCDEDCLELINMQEIKLAGKNALAYQTRTQLSGIVIIQEHICTEHAGHLYVLTNTAENFVDQSKNFNIIKNSFAFTAVSAEQFGGIGDVVSGLRQKYKANAPVSKTFEWETGTFQVLFDKEVIATSGPTFTAFPFITEDSMVKDIDATKGKTTDTTIELIYENNLGYTTETVTKTYNKETGIPIKVKVESETGSFEVEFQ